MLDKYLPTPEKARDLAIEGSISVALIYATHPLWVSMLRYQSSWDGWLGAQGIGVLELAYEHPLQTSVSMVSLSCFGAALLTHVHIRYSDINNDDLALDVQDPPNDEQVKQRVDYFHKTFRMGMCTSAVVLCLKEPLILFLRKLPRLQADYIGSIENKPLSAAVLFTAFAMVRNELDSSNNAPEDNAPQAALAN